MGLVGLLKKKWEIVARIGKGSQVTAMRILDSKDSLETKKFT